MRESGETSVIPQCNGNIIHGPVANPGSSTAVSPSAIYSNGTAGSKSAEVEGVPDSFPSSMEDSFRIVEDANLSLTTCALRDVELSKLPDHPGVSRCTLVSSFTSDCDSRLRNLGEDGLAKCVDPIQQRILEVVEGLQRTIAQLQFKLEQQSLALRRRRESEGEEAHSPLITSPGALKDEEELLVSVTTRSWSWWL